MVRLTKGLDAPTRELHVIEDRSVGLYGVVAIDSLVLGPAVGACRLRRHRSRSDMHSDAARLARTATFRSAMAGLPLGGGTAVLQLPDGPFDRERLFEAFGEALEGLGGSFILAGDGMTEADMQAVRRGTGHAFGPDEHLGEREDVSLWTARGLVQAIAAAAETALGVGLDQLRVAVQGVGPIEAKLCGLLLEAQARVIVSDTVRSEALASMRDVEVVPAGDLAGIRSEVYAPCTRRGVLDERTVDALRAGVVCGGGDGRPAADRMSARMGARGITHVPDYLADAGGFLSGAARFLGETAEQIERRVDGIASRVRAVLAQARAERRLPKHVADDLVGDALAGRLRLAA